MHMLRLATAAVLVSVATAGFGQALVSGEVRKVDTATGRLTLNHGEVKNLDMPPMNNMVYRVQNPALLADLKPGDKIQFSAEKIGGAYTVTTIRKP